MRKSNYQDYQGNDQYEGFCVDMLRELADILKFSFKIKLVDDALYGAPEPNGSWTGMVGELINRVSGGGLMSLALSAASHDVSSSHMTDIRTTPIRLCLIFKVPICSAAASWINTAKLEDNLIKVESTERRRVDPGSSVYLSPRHLCSLINT